MNQMSNEFLIKSYYQAVQLKLHPNFINLLRLELYRRSIEIICLKEQRNKTDKSLPLLLNEPEISQPKIFLG